MSELLIHGAELAGLVNKKMRARVDSNRTYQLREIDPNSLLRHDRFDLVPKVIYARCRLTNTEAGWATDGYLAHLNRINGLVEADDSNKIGAAAFLKAFDALIEDMTERGFDKSRPIPVSNGAPLDGAHRIAAAIALGISVYVVNVDGVPPHCMRASDLEIRGVSPEFLDLWATDYARLRPSSRNVFIWPSAITRDGELEMILQRHGAIVRRKNVELTASGKVNVIRIAYASERWLGSAADGFSGAVNKSRWCFERPGPLRVFLMDDVGDWLALKEEVRALYGIEKNSVHINDTHKETCELSQLVFNCNGLEYLNYHVPTNFPWFTDILDSYREWLASTKADFGDYCLVGSSVLGVYGIRQPRDLDFIALRNSKVDTGMREIDCHNGQVYWGVSDEQVIVDPRLHFVVGGIKYVTPKLLLRHKRERGESKDLSDVEEFTSVLAGNAAFRPRRRVTMAGLKAQAKFFALKLRFYIKRYLVKAGRG